MAPIIDPEGRARKPAKRTGLYIVLALLFSIFAAWVVLRLLR